MCGIAGVVMRNGSPVDGAVLDRMQAALAHRGPDGVGRLIRGDTGLLHLRLAIVDLTTGDQPLYGLGETALIANGEIYNDPDLRARMTGTPFRTHSDCEPAVFLYGDGDESFAEHLRGMYAIAIHDPARGRLVLARDPFGIKPLYFVETDSAFGFASEPSALIAAGLVAAGMTPKRRAELLQLKFTTGRDTIFPGIKRVLPGETIVVERGSIVRQTQRPALPDTATLKPVKAGRAVDELDAVLLESVTAHLRSDVPYGLFLSGGIDSSALLALMRRATDSRVMALTVGWEGGWAADESHEAERLAKVMGADCHRLEMTEHDFWTLAPRIAAAIDDPTADAAVLPTYMLGQAAADFRLKVALSGEGADELFGGYARYRKQRAPWRWISRPPRTGGLFRSVPPLDDWREGLADAETLAAHGHTRMQAVQATDIAEWLPNDLLNKLDRCLMIHGVEGRTPFLDPAVAAFAWRLGDQQKASLRYGKVLLREWLAKAFPQAGAFAKKKGFKPPVGRWITSRLPQLSPLLKTNPGLAATLPHDAVATILGQSDEVPQRAWSLLFYALWHSHFILGVDPSGDVGEVLTQAARAG